MYRSSTLDLDRGDLAWMNPCRAMSSLNHSGFDMLYSCPLGFLLCKLSWTSIPSSSKTRTDLKGFNFTTPFGIIKIPQKNKT